MEAHKLKAEDQMNIIIADGKDVMEVLDKEDSGGSYAGQNGCGGAGGGGWYGGGGNLFWEDGRGKGHGGKALYAGGSGGSGYIGGVTNGEMQSGVRSGNGYDNITRK